MVKSPSKSKRKRDIFDDPSHKNKVQRKSPPQRSPTPSKFINPSARPRSSAAPTRQLQVSSPSVNASSSPVSLRTSRPSGSSTRLDKPGTSASRFPSGLGATLFPSNTTKSKELLDRSRVQIPHEVPTANSSKQQATLYSDLKQRLAILESKTVDLEHYSTKVAKDMKFFQTALADYEHFETAFERVAMLENNDASNEATFNSHSDRLDELEHAMSALVLDLPATKSNKAGVSTRQAAPAFNVSLMDPWKGICWYLYHSRWPCVVS